MKNTFGSNISITLFGESHGEMIGCVLDGFPAGLPFDEEYISRRMDLRRPVPGISTTRSEPDPVHCVSGVYRGFTCGTPICLLIPNTQADSRHYENLPARPGHADLTAHIKYHGFEDPRGGGHFSGRLTAPLTAAGAFALSILKRKGIRIGTHILRLGVMEDRPFRDPVQDINALDETVFPVLDAETAEKMKQIIQKAAAEKDSIGGMLESCVTGLPGGIGEPWFDSLEGMLSHALFSVPAVKGVEFGDGFRFAGLRGSECIDALRVKEGRVITESNHNGGINGGISNGMPLLLRCAVKPTPSIFITQNTVDLKTGRETPLSLTGRHDPAIVHRARPAVDSMIALTLCDQLAARFGSEWFREEE